jgi:proteic killer suppression protein
VILSIKDNRAKRIYSLELVGKIPPELQPVALRKLRMLNSVKNLNDLRIPPTNALRRLLGHRQGQFNIRINEDWRICFDWHDGNAHNVEIINFRKEYRV